jgi:hypothetical protein
MRIFKQFILFYLIGMALLLIVGVLAGTNILSLPLILWFLPLIFNLIGMLAALVVYEFKMRPVQKKLRIYRNGFIFGLICIITLLVTLRLTNKNGSSVSTNSSKNHDVMKYFVDDNEEHVRLAFNRLESEFKDPNDFRLDAFSVRTSDTTINGNDEPIYNIYFTYFLAPDSNKYFSKVSVFGDTPKLQLYNLDTRTNTEYQNIKTENEKTERESIQSLKESFEQMPDSTRIRIIDTIKKILN